MSRGRRKPGNWPCPSPQAARRQPQDHGSVVGGAPPRMPPNAEEEPFNIIPIHNLPTGYPSLRYPEVRAAAAALRAVGDLRKPPFVAWNDGMDLLDWLGAFFGFQSDNVCNQREHLVFLLANAQMRIARPPNNINALDPSIVRRLHRKLLSNYTSWCNYLGRESNVCISDADPRRNLLYASLYLLIWGESANLRFVPECLCYIFHHMAMELNRILEDYIDENTGLPVLPSVSGENAFLHRVVVPIYNIIKAEVESSCKGTAPHSAWRNYDDINEYFWSCDCFDKLKWPLDLSSNFFIAGGVGKTGFVEQRSFWNVFRSFDRLWIMHVLCLQAAIIIALEDTTYPWEALQNRAVQVQVLTIFITWAGLRFLQSLLDAGMQYSLVSRETPWIGMRMVLKSSLAAAWTLAFSIMYHMIWSQRDQDGRWSAKANWMLVNFLKAGFVFMLPELLTIALFLLPWVQNFIEKTNWKILYVLTWWSPSMTFVGRGLRQGIVDNIKYTLFWAMILAAKFSFSYFLQVKPMTHLTKAILDIGDIKYRWHQFFSNYKDLFAVGMLWAPVVLIYFMDVQIWCSIFTSIVGALIGWFSHMGEIRNIDQVRQRFQLFAGAMQFNLIPEEQQLRRRRKRTVLKMESNQAEAYRFALIWNEIITTFREEDIISDHEVELMELTPNSWNIRVIQWPCLFIRNELLLALNQTKELAGTSDNVLWRKICKNEYRRCAVIEFYDSIKHLLLDIIIKGGTEEHKSVYNLFQEIDEALQNNKFTHKYRRGALPEIHTKLISLVDLLTEPKEDLTQVVNSLQTLSDIVIQHFQGANRNVEQMRQDELRMLFENAVNKLPDAENTNFYKQVRRLKTILTSSRDSMLDFPKNLEARRRIIFFCNSMFMNMPRAPQVEMMQAFSVLTPYYNEDVLYSRERLRKQGEGGMSFLDYLQKTYDYEWSNFEERMRRNGMVDEEELWKERWRDLCLWASNRGQTLSRTVRGMMYYYKTLKMQAFLDSASEMDITEGCRELAAVDSMRRNSSFDGLCSSVLMKYTYVVACQVYGTQKVKKDPRAFQILNLMRHNEALRVAYVDEVRTGSGSDEFEYYSVLVKYDQQLQKEVEIYRIRLPGHLKLGEGKPENQNHAIIFTRGDAVQTIDMNQDNYFEETLKMRNLLEEFHSYYGINKPKILGVCEHIFTGSVSSLAQFMSAQETTFVTIVQRVLANPLKVRMHYGHPDVFDRLWFLSRGGLSKASMVINISEDIFAGFNCTLRGGNVTHHEYIQVGKGRDVGLDQISMFDAKIASGNAEQVLSRDVYRLGHRLDFFRMLSFFYTSVGFFFNTMMVVLSFYTFVWGRLYLSLSGIGDKILNATVSSNTAAVATIVNQQFIIQLGLFTALPIIVENSLEHGFLPSVCDFLKFRRQLASVFYTFSTGTRTHFYRRTILHGGAEYRATGRGFAVERKSFAEIYRLHARSHFVKALELGMILTVNASYSPVATSTLVYRVTTISGWFLVVSWIMAPFVFNPSGFDFTKTKQDYEEFMKWIWYRGRASTTTKADESWETWWCEEQDHLRNNSLLGRLLEIILNLRFFFFQFGIMYQLGISIGITSIAAFLQSWIYLAVFVVLSKIFVYADHWIRYLPIVFGGIFLSGPVTILLIFKFIVLTFLLAFIPTGRCMLSITQVFRPEMITSFKFINPLASLLAFIPPGWGMLSIAQVFRPVLQTTMAWDMVVSVARLYDILFGVIVMTLVAYMSWIPVFLWMQTRILFKEVGAS